MEPSHAESSFHAPLPHSPQPPDRSRLTPPQSPVPCRPHPRILPSALHRRPDPRREVHTIRAPPLPCPTEVKPQRALARHRELPRQLHHHHRPIPVHDVGPRRRLHPFARLRQLLPPNRPHLHRNRPRRLLRARPPHRGRPHHHTRRLHLRLHRTLYRVRIRHRRLPRNHHPGHRRHRHRCLQSPHPGGRPLSHLRNRLLQIHRRHV
jgi:hypothetical protein